MPKTAIKYENILTYKVCCKDIDIKDIYVGHTTNFTKRKSEHKSICSNVNNKKYNTFLYTFIRANGGWKNWDMIEISKIRCNDSNEAKAQERKLIEELKPTLNKAN